MTNILRNDESRLLDTFNQIGAWIQQFPKQGVMRFRHNGEEITAYMEGTAVVFRQGPAEIRATYTPGVGTYQTGGEKDRTVPNPDKINIRNSAGSDTVVTTRGNGFYLKDGLNDASVRLFMELMKAYDTDPQKSEARGGLVSGIQNVVRERALANQPQPVPRRGGAH